MSLYKRDLMADGTRLCSAVVVSETIYPPDVFLLSEADEDGVVTRVPANYATLALHCATLYDMGVATSDPVSVDSPLEIAVPCSGDTLIKFVRAYYNQSRPCFEYPERKLHEVYRDTKGLEILLDYLGCTYWSKRDALLPYVLVRADEDDPLCDIVCGYCRTRTEAYGGWTDYAYGDVRWFYCETCGSSGLLHMDADVETLLMAVDGWRKHCEEIGFKPNPCWSVAGKPNYPGKVDGECCSTWVSKRALPECIQGEHRESYTWRRYYLARIDYQIPSDDYSIWFSGEDPISGESEGVANEQLNELFGNWQYGPTAESKKNRAAFIRELLMQDGFAERFATPGATQIQVCHDGYAGMVGRCLGCGQTLLSVISGD